MILLTFEEHIEKSGGSLSGKLEQISHCRSGRVHRSLGGWAGDQIISNSGKQEQVEGVVQCTFQIHNYLKILKKLDQDKI